MKTNGRSFGISDVVVADTPFTYRGKNIYSTKILVGTTGNIVYRNSVGDLQYIASAPTGYHDIAASEIVASGTVNGVSRTTTASNMTYCCSIVE